MIRLMSWSSISRVRANLTQSWPRRLEMSEILEKIRCHDIKVLGARLPEICSVNGVELAVPGLSEEAVLGLDGEDVLVTHVVRLGVDLLR